MFSTALVLRFVELKFDSYFCCHNVHNRVLIIVECASLISFLLADQEVYIAPSQKFALFDNILMDYMI